MIAFLATLATQPSYLTIGATNCGPNTNPIFCRIASNPSLTAVQMALSALTVLLAALGGPWLAHIASQMPIHVETTLTRNGHTRRAHRVVVRKDGIGLWLGRVTMGSVWVAAAVVIAIIWSFDRGLGPTEQRTAILAAKKIGGQISGSLIVIAATLGFASFFQRTLDYALARSHLNPNLVVLGGRLLYAALLIVGLVIILAIWGVGLVIPVALIGVLSVALSLALQDILRNIVAGIYLLIERPFLIGDFITVSTYSGTVEEVQVRVTWLKTLDGERVVVPNSVLFTSPVVNQSAYHTRRAALAVTLPKEEDAHLPVIEHAIMTALDEVDAIRDDPEPQVTLTRASADKVELRVFFWLPAQAITSGDGTLSDVMDRIRKAVPTADVAPLDAAPAA